MNRTQILVAGLIGALLCVLSIWLLDRPIAEFAEQHPAGRELFAGGTSLLEVIFGMTISKFALGFVLLASGALLWLKKNWRVHGKVLLMISLTHLLSRLIAGMLKNVFERLRPFELLESGAWDKQFFVEGGSSFPSGHAAHFWSLYFPLALIFPRYRAPLAIIPIFISIARVGVNDHFLSDVLFSFALAALITVAFLYAFKRDDRAN